MNDSSQEFAGPWIVGPFVTDGGHVVDADTWLHQVSTDPLGKYKQSVMQVLWEIIGLTDNQRAAMRQCMWSEPDSGSWHYAMSAAGWRALDAADSWGLRANLEYARELAVQAANSDQTAWLAGNCAVTAIVCREVIIADDFAILMRPMVAAGLDH
ncbi:MULTISPECIES: hypothetical protein [unclassified Microbacterium]|uniref:hypothetical protein n=1 Tax=unclassified Microbacterium TaxID=2609290 RepID=UPI0030181111